MTNDPVVSVRLPQALLDKMDAIIIEQGYRNRADFINEAIREYLKAVQDENAASGGGRGSRGDPRPPSG